MKVKIELFEEGQFAVSSDCEIKIGKNPPLQTVELDLPDVQGLMLIHYPQAFLEYDKDRKKLKVKSGII